MIYKNLQSIVRIIIHTNKVKGNNSLSFGKKKWKYNIKINFCVCACFGNHSSGHELMTIGL